MLCVGIMLWLVPHKAPKITMKVSHIILCDKHILPKSFCISINDFEMVHCKCTTCLFLYFHLYIFLQSENNISYEIEVLKNFSIEI